jgi:hypothetical protein
MGKALDMNQKGLSRDRLHYLGVDPAITLQKAKDVAFASRTSASLSLSCTPQVGLIHPNLTRKLGAFQICRMKEHHFQSLIHPSVNFIKQLILLNLKF